jgi:hypothetical protein
LAICAAVLLRDYCGPISCIEKHSRRNLGPPKLAESEGRSVRFHQEKFATDSLGLEISNPLYVLGAMAAARSRQQADFAIRSISRLPFSQPSQTAQNRQQPSWRMTLNVARVTCWRRVRSTCDSLVSRRSWSICSTSRMDFILELDR